MGVTAFLSTICIYFPSPADSGHATNSWSIQSKPSSYIFCISFFFEYIRDIAFNSWIFFPTFNNTIFIRILPIFLCTPFEVLFFLSTEGIVFNLWILTFNLKSPILDGEIKRIHIEKECARIENGCQYLPSISKCRNQIRTKSCYIKNKYTVYFRV